MVFRRPPLVNLDLLDFDTMARILSYGHGPPEICPFPLLKVHVVVLQFVCDADNWKVLDPTVAPRLTSVLLLNPVGVPLARVPDL